MNRPIAFLAALSGFLLAGAVAIAQEQRPNRPQAQTNPAAQFAPMIEAIRNTPGCLGVEAARLQSGKFAIFAFFKDKEAAKAWYYDPAHKQAMQRMMPDAVPPDGHEPMSDVPAGVPVLAAATITPPAAGQQGLPQISIELYTPLSGGLRVGGGFAPEGFAPAPPPATQPSAQ
ncbi:MAG TPA: antibiotic biosynthesis monooxygenase [Tepidisphaeraceae bacterium]|nr:antibiotic biosynthesis monooxygenase [Tepidisphaeraceae bacterium]